MTLAECVERIEAYVWNRRQQFELARVHAMFNSYANHDPKAMPTVAKMLGEDDVKTIDDLNAILREHGRDPIEG